MLYNFNTIPHYTPSFPLQLQFIKNANNTGVMAFIQLKRTNNVILYKRVKQDGKVFGYEVIITKTIIAGTPLPGGLTVEYDYEKYPGYSEFGRAAWFCTDLDHANKRFQHALELINKRTEDNLAEEQPNAMYTLPDGSFSMNELCAANNNADKLIMYGKVKKMIADNILKIVGKEQRGKGRATILYSKI